MLPLEPSPTGEINVADQRTPSSAAARTLSILSAIERRWFKMNKVHVVLIIGCFLAVLFFSPFNLRSATWIVKSDGSGDAPTIQAAIDSAFAGDTILVFAGLYVENSIFINKDQLTLISKEGPENTILEDSDPPPNILGLSNSSHVVVKGFTFRNCVWTALTLYQCYNILIEDNIFSNNVLHAIYVELCSNVTIKECLLYENSNGIYMLGNGCILSNNTISHNAGDGVCLQAIATYELSNNLIVYNDMGVTTGIGSSIICSCNNVFNYGFNYTIDPDPTGTNGNISIDPQYCAFDPPGSGNFYIQSDSPCLPGNHPIGYPCGLIGKYSAGCGETSVKSESWGKIKFFNK